MRGIAAPGVRVARRVELSSEAGGLGVGLGALGVTLGLIVVYLGIPLAVAAVHDVHDLVTGRWSKPPEVSAGGGSAFPYIGPPLPADPVQAKCVVTAANAAGLQFGDHGWEAPGVYPKPPIGSSQGTIDAWQSQITSYYASRQDEWASCLTTQPPLSSTTSTSTPIAFAGTYAISYPSSADATCPYSPPATVTVGGSADNATFTLTSSDFTDQLTGSVGSGGDLTANGVRDVGGGLGMRMLGTFNADGSTVTIQNGQLTFNGPTGPCTFDFTGTKK